MPDAIPTLSITPTAAPAAETPVATAASPAPALTPDEIFEQGGPEVTAALAARLSPDYKAPVAAKVPGSGDDVTSAPVAEPAAQTIKTEPGAAATKTRSDARTATIMGFLDRNQDATMEDAVAFADSQAPAPAPAPAARVQPVAPATTAILARISDLDARIKAGTDAMGRPFDPALISDLRSQVLDAQVDLRFARRDERQAAQKIIAQREQARQENVDRAIALCPEILDLDTPQGQAFSRIYAAYTAAGDPILNNDNAARLIALEVMDETGYVRKPAGTLAPVNPAPAAVPLLPRTTLPLKANGANGAAVLPPTPTGAARITPAVAPTREAFIAALDDADGSEVSGLVERLSGLAAKRRPTSRFDLE
jgi:hypothetical protein